MAGGVGPKLGFAGFTTLVVFAAVERGLRGAG
jgi:hypothetical protein